MHWHRNYFSTSKEMFFSWSTKGELKGGREGETTKRRLTSGPQPTESPPIALLTRYAKRIESPSFSPLPRSASCPTTSSSRWS